MPAEIRNEMGLGAWSMLLLLSFVWGGSFFFNAVLIEALSPLAIVFLRVAIAAVALWIYVVYKQLPVPKTIIAWLALLTMGLINNVIPFGLIVWAQTSISSSLASILNATVPIMTVVLATLLLADEKINKRKLIGVVVGFIGTAWVIGPGSSDWTPGNSLAQLAMLGAALSYSFAGIFGRRFSRIGLHPVVTAAGQVTASTVLLFPVILFSNLPMVIGDLSALTGLTLLGLGLFSTALAYILYFRVLAIAGATNLGLVTFLIPAWATLFGVGLLSENVTGNQFAGFAVLAIGLIIIDGRLWRTLFNR